MEALLEIRFDAASMIPEAFFGRLIDYDPWKGFQRREMPAYRTPAFLRQVDPNLRYQPLFELVDPVSARVVRVGAQMLSYHRLAPYVGWEQFRIELDEAIKALFQKAENPPIQRLGLRYINALNPQIHGIRSISDLDLSVSVDRERISDRMNISFSTELAPNIQGTTRVASPEFVQGNLPEQTSVVIDVDIFTSKVVDIKGIEEVKRWAESAHDQEKRQFFRLLTRETIDRLTEE